MRVLEKAESPDSDKLADLHRHKNGTPTMGGVGILAGVLGAGLLWADLTNPYVLVAMGAGRDRKSDECSGRHDGSDRSLLGSRHSALPLLPCMLNG